MTSPVLVALQPSMAHLASTVLDAGATPLVDATAVAVPEVPEGAWVRSRPGRPAPGNGPVILAELGAPLPDRPTWLETSVGRPIPNGYAGLVLKGREAGGLTGEEDGLVALARCPEPGRVVLDAGLGPDVAAAAAALGAAGVMLVEQHLALPEVNLAEGLFSWLERDPEELTRVVAGLRVANPPTAAVLRKLIAGDDPWQLAADIHAEGGLDSRLWFAGQGLALARELADRYGDLGSLLRAYLSAFGDWRARAAGAGSQTGVRPVSESWLLSEPGVAATVGGTLGSGVLWQQAMWAGAPLHGGSLLARMAVGGSVAAEPAQMAKELADLPPGPQTGTAPPPAQPAPPPGDPADVMAPAVAIVGMGCIFPAAPNLETFWNNLVSGVSAIGPVPTERWDPELYWSEDKAAPDRTYAKIGGFLRDFVFEPKKFRIPPAVASAVDPVQQLTLTAVAAALEDADLKVDRRSGGREFNRERCAVILGNSLGGEITDAYAIRLAWPDVARRLLATPPLCTMVGAEREQLLAAMEEAYKAGLPIVNEDSMPGELANVIAGRIANAFDLGGANFTVDAACASSMAALQQAIRSLQDGESDMVITGGADRSMGVATYVKFCKIGALSPDHSAPFDASANGFVMGEGAGIMVLKRLEDAVADSDKIYAVIRGVGASSDGKGKGITAPNIKGQIRALRRAYAAAGVDPSTVDLIEAHGTSTVVGDRVEAQALTEVIGPDRRNGRPVRIGSVKSMIGHLKSAAGAASCIKAALALHHGQFLPSLGYRNSREDVPMDTVPLAVQTKAEPWPVPEGGARRCGISAFGFGGTNFHIVMEGWSGQPFLKTPKVLPPASLASMRPAAPAASPPPPAPAPVRVPVTLGASVSQLPEGVWAVSGRDQAELLANARELARGGAPSWQPSAPWRISAGFIDGEERASQLQRATRALEKSTNPDLLRARAIYLETVPFDGKLAMLFTGQGSQYLGMGLDLAEHFDIVRHTYAEANDFLLPALGRPLTSFLTLGEGEDPKEKSAILQRTEYAQPAVLTFDVALLRLLSAYGVSPDLVAGHSLGEYGAAVAAGIMSFEQGLRAVSARGREMAAIRIDDPGKMAGVAASARHVEEVLAEIDGYVVAANKNCPSQTVIAGASDAVDEAVERFRARGTTVHPLAVSHAFHSEIVRPASEPLRTFLSQLGLGQPRRPITTNVTGEYYPTGPGAQSKIIDLLGEQISAPVEWTAQMERMYADGARVFVECGPKRALTGFAVSILKRRPHRALYTNHPKRGGLASFRDSLAGLVALGLPIRAVPLPMDQVDLFADPLPRHADSASVAAFTSAEVTTVAADTDLTASIIAIVATTGGYDLEDIQVDDELEADLGIDTVKQAEVLSIVRETYGLGNDAAPAAGDSRTVRALVDWVASQIGAPSQIAVERALPVPTSLPGGVAQSVSEFLDQAKLAGGMDKDSFSAAVMPAIQGLLEAAFSAAASAHAQSQPPPPVPTPAPVAAPVAAAPAPVASTRLPGHLLPANVGASIVVTGASLGLPGGLEVFDPNNIASILAGENRIEHIGKRAAKFLEMGLVRLVKDPSTGQGSFVAVESEEQVIRLAGQKAHFDLSAWGVDAGLVRALDVTTQLSFAAGLEAMADAGIPLVRTYKESAAGKQVPQGWALPAPLQDTTGVIFASAFPGYDRLIEKVMSGGDDGEGRFDRRFLFQVLAMGHSQFAQFIGAKGPNATANQACASTTAALAMAGDWIRLGRCERVIVVGADDVTSEQLMPWIGGGFMAAGAATTSDKVEEAALPFDARRHGMILGMGAVGFVVETEEAAADRGMVPLAEQVGELVINSAFHGTRLDTDHIASAMKGLVADVAAREQTTPSAMAAHTFFMSHETYTPARGGSAAAEIRALREAFGDAASQVVVTNTKGFTGHAMGAGIEDAVALKALQYSRVPPIPNLREPDPELGDLRLSQGEELPFRYAVRLAAGFGSQLALSVWKGIATGDERVASAEARLRWLQEITGLSTVEEFVSKRTLRVQEATANSLIAPMGIHESEGLSVDMAPEREAGPQLEPGQAILDPRAGGLPVLGFDEILAVLVEIVAQKTGYDVEEIEPDFELEADLGIDTVKQAEILSEITDRLGLATDDDFRLTEYPTMIALAGYLSGAVAGAGDHHVAPTSLPAPERAVAAPRIESASPAAPAANTLATVLGELLEVVAEKTGYEVDEMEPDFELEADLGIDTVKQAEILGELRTRYGLEEDEEFRLSEHPTIEALAAYLASRMGSTQSDEPAQALEPAGTSTPTVASQTPPSEPARTCLPELLEMVAESTGYDISDLEPDFELEADLGVDTVKQAELMGALRDRYGLETDDDFQPAEHRTLAALAAYVDARRGSESAVPEEPLADIIMHPGLTPPADPQQVPWQQPEPKVARMPTDEVPWGSPAPTQEGFDAPLPGAVEARPNTALPPGFAVRRPVAKVRVGSDLPLTEASFHVFGEGALARLLRDGLAERGLVHVEAGRADVVVDADGAVLECFARAQDLGEHRPSRWVALTRLGGHSETRVSSEEALLHGSRSGFAKSLGREWEATTATVLDLAPSLDDAACVEAVWQELGRQDVEVFVGDERRVLSLERVEVPQFSPLRGQPVVLISGGARGICHTVAMELARRGPIKLALIGRTPLPDTAIDLAAKKAEIKAALAAEGGRVTPAAVAAKLAPFKKASEALDNIAMLRHLGAEVIYESADLADPHAAAQVVEAVSAELGDIHVLIHGAGVEESRLIADKDVVAFRRVFDGKALGGRALIDAVSDDTFVVSMGSVAGRFGNPGQVDYAAANDALARICLARGGALHVDWTAWGDVGMAVRGGMQRLLEDRGVDLLPAAAGASLLADLIGSQVSGELVVAGRLGDFEESVKHPLLDSLEIDGETATGTRDLSRSSDGWMVDHSIDDTPVLPGVIGLELMAAVAAPLFDGKSFTGARNVRFHAPVKLHGDRTTTVVMEASVEREGAASVRLTSIRKLRTGKLRRTEHYTATILFGEREPIEALPSAFLPDESIVAGAIYQRFFHGPRFQVLAEVYGVSADGLVGEGVAPNAGIAEGLLTSPLLLEAAFQAAGLHKMLVAHEQGLPLEIDEVQWLSMPSEDEQFSLTVLLADGEYHVDADGLSGPLLRLRGFKMVDTGPLPPGKRFEEPAVERPVCFPISRVEVTAARSRTSEACHTDDPSPWLTEEELATLRSRGNAKRVADRVAGRIAAKRALSSLTSAHPHSFSVSNLPSGEPVVEGLEGVVVSISHRDALAVAVARRGKRVGIDLERVELRAPSFAAQWFTPGEQQFAAGSAERETLVWAVKEAVVKALGTGFAVPPKSVELVGINGHSVAVRLHGAASERLAVLGAGGLEVRWQRNAQHVVCEARLAG